ncbi:MAG: glycerol-3-phosphate 1-O-acyltransferase PlsY [Alphaproteobacteria bacterium]
MPDPISWAEVWPYFMAALAGGYLLGSIPFGLVFTRMAGLGDIRDVGSGNIGATNVLRTGNKAIAIATLLFDALKGAAALLIADYFYGPDIAIAAGCGAFIGHIFPVWLRFNGGKGVATFLGLMLAAHWPLGLMACATWLITAAIFRISSLSALVAVALCPVYFIALFDMWQWGEASALLAVLVYIRHKENIQRLLKGEEPKIGAGKDKKEAA